MTDYDYFKEKDVVVGTPSDRFAGKIVRMDSLISPPLIGTNSMITPMNSNVISNQGISPIDLENDKKRAKKVGEFGGIWSKEVCRVESADLVLRVNEKHALERLSVTGIYEKTGDITLADDGSLRENGKIIARLEDKDCERVSQWLRARAEKCEAIKLAPSTPSPKKKKKMKTRKFGFVDLEGSSIEFKLVDGKMQEWCDGKMILDDVKAITLNVPNATIFDGIEMCPLLRDDVIQASCWFEQAKHECEDMTYNVITASPRRRRDSSSSSTSEVFKQRNCSFIDMDNTNVAFVLNEKYILEEWCDGVLEMKCVREIKLNEDGILHDGEETIPLRSEDVERVTTWFRDVSAFVKKCKVTVPDKNQEEEEKEEEPKLKSSVRMLEESMMEDVNQRCSFKGDGNTFEFVSSRDGVLELYCDNILEYTSLSQVNLNEDNGVLDIETEEFEILMQDIDRVSNWLQSNSSNLPFCDIQITKNDGNVSFVSSVAEESSDSEDDDDDEEEEEEESILPPRSISESFQRIPRFCEFKDEEGTEISFTLNEIDGVTLEEWCDGELTISCIRVLKINKANSTIHDGEEEIPVSSDDFSRVINWLRSVGSEANVTIEDIVVDEEETKGESFMADEEEKVDDSVVVEEEEERVGEKVGEKVETKKKVEKKKKFEKKKKVEKKKKRSIERKNKKKKVENKKKKRSIERKNKKKKVENKKKKRSIERKNTNQERKKRKKKIASSTNCVVSSFDFHVESGVRLDLNGDNGTLELWQGFDQLMQCVEEIRMDESHRVEISSSDEKQRLILSPNVRNGLSAWLRQVSIGLKRAICVTDRFTIGHALRCEFVDNENSEIVFCVQNKKLQEWVDGKLEVPHIKKLRLSRSRSNPSIHDGEEEIPIGSLEQFDRVSLWLRTTSRLVSFEIEDVEMDLDDEEEEQQMEEDDDDEGDDDEDDDDEDDDDDEEEEEEEEKVEEKEQEEPQPENVEDIETASDNTQQEQQSKKVENENIETPSNVQQQDRPIRPCEFTDEEGSEVVLLITDEGDLQEHVDGKIVMSKMKRIVVNEHDVFDGEEKIPLSSRNMKKVTRWLNEVLNRTNCEIAFSVSDKAEKENEPPQVNTKKIDDTNTKKREEHKSPPWASIVQTATSSLCLAHMNPHDEIPIRGSEINKIMTFIRERVEQQNGGAMYICGSPGTGKSIAVSRAVYNLNRPTESSTKSSSLSSPSQMEQEGSIWKQRLPQPLPVQRLRAVMARENMMKSLQDQSRSLRFDFASCNAMTLHNSSHVFTSLCRDLRLHERHLCTSCRSTFDYLPSNEAKANHLLRCRLTHPKGVAQRAMTLVVIDEIDGLVSTFLYSIFSPHNSNTLNSNKNRFESQRWTDHRTL